VVWTMENGQYSSGEWLIPHICGPPKRINYWREAPIINAFGRFSAQFDCNRLVYPIRSYNMYKILINHQKFFFISYGIIKKFTNITS
jgi:hypothetical protein